MHRLVFRRGATKALKKMPPEVARRIHAELEKLAQNPKNLSYSSIRLKGHLGYRLKVAGWSVIFERNEESREILVVGIGPRGDVYKRVHEDPGVTYDQTTSNFG